MKRQVIIALTICACVAVIIGCGSPVTTIHARKQTTERETVVETNLTKGVSLYQSGDYADSEKALILAAECDSADWRPQQYLGLVRFELGHYRRAAEDLLRSLDLAPDDGPTRAGLYAALGECWESLKKPGKARLHYHTALNIWPRCAEARDGLTRLGSISETKGR